MRQKFVITQGEEGDGLKISEYAVIDRDLKNVASELLREMDYSLLCVETYEDSAIERSIEIGMDALVDTLRTRNLYPIEPYAARIAESVKALYGSEDVSMELFFDDTDLFEIGADADGP